MESVKNVFEKVKLPNDFKLLIGVTIFGYAVFSVAILSVVFQ